MSKYDHKGPSSPAIWSYSRRKLTASLYGGGDGTINIQASRNTLANGAQYTYTFTGMVTIYVTDVNCNLEISGDGTNWDGANIGAVNVQIALYGTRARLNNDTGAGITYAHIGWKFI